MNSYLALALRLLLALNLGLRYRHLGADTAARASTTIMLAEAIVQIMRHATPASLRRQRPRDGVVVGAAV